MSTPTRRTTGVHAPFKSPLRTNAANLPKRNAGAPASSPNPCDPSHPIARGCRYEEEDKAIDEASIDAEIERLTQELMRSRTHPLDIEHELSVWRSRMHAYNEAKDACLELFGELAQVKGCLVRELYTQFGLETTD